MQCMCVRERENIHALYYQCILYIVGVCKCVCVRVREREYTLYMYIYRGF